MTLAGIFCHYRSGCYFPFHTLQDKAVFDLTLGQIVTLLHIRPPRPNPCTDLHEIHRQTGDTIWHPHTIRKISTNFPNKFYRKFFIKYFDFFFFKKINFFQKLQNNSKTKGASKHLVSLFDSPYFDLSTLKISAKSTQPLWSYSSSKWWGNLSHF